jgi:hypothetical protein
MIVRRLVESMKDRNWTTLGLELVIVVLGVFLGLQAQAWSEERGRRGLEAAYTERLHDDVVGLQERRALLVEFRERWNAGLQSLSPVLFGTVDRPVTADECGALAASYIVSNPTDDLASLIELQSSGRLSMFRNERVSGAMQGFLLTRARARDSQAGISRGMPTLSMEFPDLIRVVAPTVATVLPPVSATVECDLSGMRADPAFLNAFEVVQSNFAFHVGDNARVSQSLEELHTALDETLGLTHDDSR